MNEQTMDSFYSKKNSLANRKKYAAHCTTTQISTVSNPFTRKIGYVKYPISWFYLHCNLKEHSTKVLGCFTEQEILRD